MKILFCSDGSEASMYAVEKIFPLLTKKSTIDILNVMELTFLVESSPMEFQSNINDLKNKSINKLQETQQLLETKGAKVGEILLEQGNPAEIILKYVHENNYKFIIMGSHGKKGLDQWIGSVSRKIATKSPIPIVIASPPKLPEIVSEKKEILFAVDGSECSYNAINQAIKDLKLEYTHIEIIYIKPGIQELPPEILEDKEWLSKILAKQEEIGEKILHDSEKIFSKHKINVNSKIIIEGNPAEEIIKYLEKQKKDLIVLGSHGREGFASLLLGSVSKRVLENTHTPVLIIPTKRIKNENQ